MRACEDLSPRAFAIASGTVVDARRPNPLIPLRTALDNVSIRSSASLFVIPAVCMLTNIASARSGVRITSITTDVRFVVVLAFISFVCSTRMRCSVLRDEQVDYNQCASGPSAVFVGLWLEFVACG